MIKDVISKVFTILSHTPIEAVGINFESHVPCKEDVETKLKSLFAGQADIFSKVLTENYRINGTLYCEFEGAQVTIRITKSEKEDDCIFVNLNFHNVLESKEADTAVKKINEQYDKSREEAVSYISGLIIK